MGLEVVVNEIIEEGRKEADRIEREGLEEAKAILEDARSKAEKAYNERDEQAKRDAARIEEQEASRAEFEAKRRVLTAKRNLWERLKKDILKALLELDEDRRRKYLQTLIENARREIPEGAVHVRKQDEGLVRGVRGFDVKGDLEAIGGVVVEDPQGNVSLDLRFEALLDDLWPQVLKQESKRLFR